MLAPADHGDAAAHIFLGREIITTYSILDDVVMKVYASRVIGSS